MMARIASPASRACCFPLAVSEMRQSDTRVYTVSSSLPCRTPSAPLSAPSPRRCEARLPAHAASVGADVGASGRCGVMALWRHDIVVSWRHSVVAS